MVCRRIVPWWLPSDHLNNLKGADTRFRKSDWYSAWQGHRKFDLFGERNEKKHSLQRKLVSRIYSMDGLRDLEPYVDSSVMALLSKMSQIEGQTIDMSLWAQLFAFGMPLAKGYSYI